MDFERQNKLPEGVGKKIIEALKTTREKEFEDFSGFESQNQNKYLEHQPCNKYQDSEYPEYKNYTYESNSPKIFSNDEEYVVSRDYNEPKINDKDSFGSSNIDTLVDLVTKLPPGVTKQTGAQIIRHTMEAMGIPMNQVLAKAQMAQEDLEQGIKNNINVIEEHRSKIKTLDMEIQQFRKKAHDLEDIISLFILSENNKR
ncbi:MAG TPA: hypothetical protein DDW90_03175 [Cyanobacteria bacterium UBA9971]|nr:hypothetical protein [Cyanobacteria bacterium UBA9971]